jgi:mannonate dehydratase
MNYIPTLFARLRREFGPELHLLHDVHHRLTPIEAGRVGKALEPYHLFWMEDPTPAELQESFRLIRQHTTTPLAVGEVFNSILDCQTLIQEQLIDYIRTTVVHAGGITHLRRIANLAEIYRVRTGSHTATDLSPVCMGAALHFDLSVHNFGIQEYMKHTDETNAVFPHSYTLIVASCIQERPRELAWISTKNRQPNIRINKRICRRIEDSTGPCTIGNALLSRATSWAALLRH